MIWNEENIPKDIKFVNDMLAKKHYAFAADYIRMWAIYKYGGVYLDTDIEVIKSFDKIIEEKCFFGFESRDFVNAAVMGACKKHFCFEIIMSRLDKTYRETKVIRPIPEIVSEILLELNSNVKLTYGMRIHDIVLFSPEWFYPYNPHDIEKPVKLLMHSDITENTYAIHHWNKSWKMSIFERFRLKSKKIIESFRK